MSNTAPAQATRDRIANLARYLIEAPLTDIDAMNRDSHLEKVFSVDDEPYARHLYIDGEGVNLYLGALDALEKDRICEHIDRSTIDKELATLAYDLLQDQAGMRNGSVYQQRLNRFFLAITGPLLTYEVVFRLEGITKFPADPLTIDSVVFQGFSQELTRINSQSESTFQRQIEEFIGQPVSIVEIEAGSTEKAVSRAREYCNRALNTLRFCIVTSHNYWAVQDRELLHRLSERWLIRQTLPEKSQWYPGWKLGFRSIERDISERSGEMIRLLTQRLNPLYDGSISPKLRDRLLRSIQWIGISITRENYDDKVIDLCTAMETMLTTRDDPKKGEAIAIRSMLLAMTPPKNGDTVHLNWLMGVDTPDRWSIPSETIYKLYGKRSEIVHGSSLGICAERDYTTLRLQAANIVLSIIELVTSETRITRLKNLFDFLESREWLEKAVHRLEKQPGRDMARLADYARERLAELPEGTSQGCPNSPSES